MSRTDDPTETPLPGQLLEAERMPGHWLLARLGKRVLRPGGIELTRRMLDSLAIGASDDVVELAPGLGTTTRLVLEHEPATYVAVDRDPDAAARVRALLEGPGRSMVHGSAASTGLPDGSATVAFGEAYLTMQPASQKSRILDELARVVRPGGRVGLHEVAFAPADIDETTAERISSEMTSTIKVNVTPLTMRGWIELLSSAGFDVETHHTAPLHLLEPQRLVADEGLAGTARFVANVLRDRDARRRVMAMRRSMHTNAEHLMAVAITAVRREA